MNLARTVRTLSRIGLSCVVVAACLVESSRARADQYISRPGYASQPIDLAEILNSRNYLFEARVDSLRVEDVVMQGGCALAGPFPQHQVTRMWLHVERIWHGVLEDSTLEMRCLSAGREAVAGRHVLAWGFRNCDDGWRSWGSFYWINTDGTMSFPYDVIDRAELRGQPPEVPLRLEHIRRAIDSRPGLASSLSAFDSAASLALVRLRRVIAPDSTGKIGFECEPLAWAYGQGRELPRLLQFTGTIRCNTGLFVGDSLLVPVPEDYEGGELRFGVCPNAWGVRLGYAHGLAVPLRSLERVIDVVDRRLRVLPIPKSPRIQQGRRD